MTTNFYLNAVARLLATVTLALTLSACATVAETYQAAVEPLSLELVLDRINTSARALELEEIMLKAMPISAASKWPKQVSSMIPSAEYGKLAAIVMQESLYSMRRERRQSTLGRISGRTLGGAFGGFTFSPSPIKIKVLYHQGLLFKNFPDLYYIREYLDHEPGEEDIGNFGRKIIGGDYSPVFNKSFYRFLKYSPAFKPKREHFLGTFDGKSVEFYPNVTEAVISLADNPGDLRAALDAMEIVYDERKEKLRDIEEKLEEIKDLKEAKAGRAEKNRRKNEMKVLKAELDRIGKDYREKMKIWKVQVAAVKMQKTALSGEQKALAINIQHTIDATKGLGRDAVTLLTIALIKLPLALMNLPNELEELAYSPMAGPRIERLIRNSVSLGENASIIKNGLNLFGDEADTMDGLFDARVKIKTAGG
ncbi:MAG: hypothetical protein V3S46_04130 [Nitrospinota bacterium]